MIPKPKDIEGRVVYDLATTSGKRQYKASIEAMWRAQGGKCGLQLHSACKKYPGISLHQATFDHGIPRGMGGANRDDRPFVNGNCAACALCNQLKGSRRLETL